MRLLLSVIFSIQLFAVATASAETINVFIVAHGVDTIRNPYALIFKQDAKDDGTAKFLERIDGLQADSGGIGFWTIRVPVDATYFAPGILISVVARTGDGKTWSSATTGITTLAAKAGQIQTTKASCLDSAKVEKERQIKDMSIDKLKKLIETRSKERAAIEAEVNKRLTQENIEKIEAVERKLGLRSENEVSPRGVVSLDNLLKRLVVIDSLLGTVPRRE
jgi:hypothetical protein